MQVELLHYTVIVLQDIQWPILATSYLSATHVHSMDSLWHASGQQFVHVDYIAFAIEASDNDVDDGWQWLGGEPWGIMCMCLINAFVVWK